MRKIEDLNLLGVKTIAYKPPLNDFERKIYCTLKNNKLNFKTNFPIKGKTKLCVVDFCIFKNNKPAVVLEVKQTMTKNNRRRYDILKQLAIKIDHVARNIKLNNPNLKFIAILSSKNEPINHLSIPLCNEFIDTDKVFCNENEAISYIKSLM